MRRALFLIALAALAAPVVCAGDPEFQSIVRGVESNLGVVREHIPLFGVARFFVRVARPCGVHQLDMALFEAPARTPEDSRWFEELVRQAAGGRWSTMIRAEDRKSGEVTYICARPDGRKWKMILATFDAHDAVLFNLRVNPDVLARSLDEPRNARHALSGEREK
jgi:hypothetical protein